MRKSSIVVMSCKAYVRLMSKSKNKLSQSKPIWLVLLGLIGLGLVIAALLSGNDVILFNPKGLIAGEQHRLMVAATLIMLGFAVPVLFLLYFFAWRYRETSKKATINHQPKHGKLVPFVIWALPTAILFVLASLMLPATQKLEPRKLIADDNPLTIQVVAMRWKWLFIYPEQKLATINYIQIPVDTPVRFELTADEAPMNSFWIPHLGGQLYAMTGHQNRLNLMAEELGDYEGSAAEINGAGFAGMRFKTRVSSTQDFNLWVDATRQSANELDGSEYKKLLEPSEDNEMAFYRNPSPKLYSDILSKYKGSHGHTTGHGEYE